MKKLITLFTLFTLLAGAPNLMASESETSPSATCPGITLHGMATLSVPRNTATGSWRICFTEPVQFRGTNNRNAYFYNQSNTPEFTVTEKLSDSRSNITFVFEYSPVLGIKEIIITPSIPLRAYGDVTPNHSYSLFIERATFETVANRTIVQAIDYSFQVPANTPKQIFISPGSEVPASECPGYRIGYLDTDILSTNYGGFPTYSLNGTTVEDNDMLSISGYYLYLDEALPNYRTGNVYARVKVTINGVSTTKSVAIPIEELNHTQYPESISFYPSRNSSLVSQSVTPRITFDTNVVPGSGYITIRKVGNPFSAQLLDVNSSQVTFSQNMVYLYPSMLDYYSDYEILFDPCAIKQASSVGYYRPDQLIEDWKFTTGITLSFPRAAEDALAQDDLVAKLTSYPNPAQDKITLRLDTEEALATTLRILSLDGRVLEEEILPASQRLDYTMEVGHLARGIYMLQVIQDGMKETRKIILE